MSDRRRLTARLLELAGPLGPFVAPEARQREQDAFLAALDLVELDPLLEIAREIPDEARRRCGEDRFELELHDAILAAGRADPERLCRRLLPLLHDPHARPVAIMALGSLRIPAALPALESLSRSPDMDEGTCERLACALGDIGGAQAAELLLRMRSLPCAGSPDVAAEIDIALARCADVEAGR